MSVICYKCNKGFKTVGGKDFTFKNMYWKKILFELWYRK